MGSELYGSGPAMAHSTLENEDGDWYGCESPGGADDANILANTSTLLFKPLPPVVEGLPVVIVMAVVVELRATCCC